MDRQLDTHEEEAADAGRSRFYPDGRLPRVQHRGRRRIVAHLLARRHPIVIVADMALLAVVLCITMFGSRLLGFSRADEITITFCGSKKSLASGVPGANVIFAGQSIGAIVLPLMLFHQIQLMVCAVIAQKYAAAAARRASEAEMEEAISPA